MTSDELLGRFDAAWNELDGLVRANDRVLNTPGAGGWALKDHLVHIAAWEQSLLALLEGRDRDSAMGVGYIDSEKSTDEINHAIWEAHRHESLEAALRYFRDSHEALRAALAKLSTNELMMPYSHYQPSDADERRPVIGWVAGNTYDHYAEHIGWMLERLA